MLRISYTACLGLASGISTKFILKMCSAAKNCEKVIKNPLFGGLRSLKVINVDKVKMCMTSACYDKQHVCTYLQLFLN